MRQPIRLTAYDLACVRGGRQVFSGISFAVDTGEALIVSGPNGAGKSSLLRQVAGLVAIAAGQVSVEGGEPDASVPEQAHYLGHQDALKPALTVEENLTFWLQYFRGASSLTAALAVVGLDRIATLPAAYLSAGQRRRLSIARLIAADRPIWLLDEPTSALDTAAQAMLADLMRDHLRTGGIILAATHGPIGLDGTHELRLGATG